MADRTVPTKARRVLIYNGARLGSTRVPRKMLASIGDLPLMTRTLRNLTAAALAANASLVVTIHPSETELLDIAAAEGIENIPITDDAVRAEDWNDAFGCLLPYLRDRCDWVIDGNFLCRPFLETSTIQRIAEQALIATDPFVCVEGTRGLLWDDQLNWMYGTGTTCNTKTNRIYYQSAHLAYGFPVEMLNDEAAAIRRLKPFVIQNLRPIERIDIDTFEDLEFARLVCRGMESS